MSCKVFQVQKAQLTLPRSVVILRRVCKSKLKFAYRCNCFQDFSLPFFFYGFTKLEVTTVLNEIPLGLIAGIKGEQMSGGKGYSANQVC